MRKPTGRIMIIVKAVPIALLFSIVVIVVFTLLAWTGHYDDTEATYENIVENIPIVALTNNNAIEGSVSAVLFVQSGKVNEEMYYRFMMKNESDGKMRYHQLKALETDIYEFDKDTDEVPHIEITWRVKKHDGEIVTEYYGFIMPDDDFNGFSNIVGKIFSISIHVPQGTVDKSFSIDLND